MAVVDLTLAPQETRLIDATLACLARWGVAKTTLDDVAREAGCSRATVYRVFPGGKDNLIEATVRREIGRFLASVVTAVDGEAARPEGRPRTTVLEDVLVAGMSTAARQLAQHEALQFLLENEPEVILPLVAFSRMDRVLAIVRDFFAPHLEPHVGEEDAPRVAEWVTRLTVSYSLCPSDEYDVCDTDSVRRLVRTFVLPGLVTSTPARKG